MRLGIILIAPFIVTCATAFGNGLDVSKASDCRLLNVAFSTLAPQLATALLGPIGNYSLNSANIAAELISTARSHFSKGPNCEGMDSESRKSLFLNLSDLQSAFSILGERAGDGLVSSDGQRAFDIAVDILVTTEVTGEMRPVITEIQRSLRHSVFRMPMQSEVQLVRWSTRSLGREERLAVLRDAAQLGRWLQATLEYEYPARVSDEVERQLAASIGIVIVGAIKLNEIAKSSMNDEERALAKAAVDVFVDAIYGQAQALDFKIPAAGNSRLSSLEKRSIRIRFIKNVATAEGQSRGIPEVVGTVAYHVHRHIFEALLTLDPDSAGTLLLERMWGLAFSGTYRAHYARGEKKGLALNPTGGLHETDADFSQLIKLKGRVGIAELEKLIRTLKAATSNQWPSFTSHNIDIDLNFQQLSKTLNGILNRVDDEGAEEDVAPDSGPNLQAVDSLERNRFRLRSMNPEARVRRFKDSLEGCANTLSSVVDLLDRSGQKSAP